MYILEIPGYQVESSIPGSKKLRGGYISKIEMRMKKMWKCCTKVWFGCTVRGVRTFCTSVREQGRTVCVQPALYTITGEEMEIKITKNQDQRWNL